jgi:putative sigma-54 modulation protein
MNLIVTGHHLDVTDSLRHYVTSKLDRLERHSDDVTDVHVILTVEKQRQKAEATVNVKGAQLFADTIEEDMYAAIDLLTDKLDRQLIKHKEKLKDHHRKDKDKLNIEE